MKRTGEGEHELALIVTLGAARSLPRSLLLVKRTKKRNFLTKRRLPSRKEGDELAWPGRNGPRVGQSGPRVGENGQKWPQMAQVRRP